MYILDTHQLKKTSYIMLEIESLQKSWKICSI